MFSFFGIREPPPSYVFAQEDSFAGVRLDQTFSSLPEVRKAVNSVQWRLTLTQLEERKSLECARDRNHMTKEQHLGIAVLQHCGREHTRLSEEIIEARRQLREKERSQNPSKPLFCE